MKMCSSTPSCFLWLPSQEAATEWPKWEIKSCHSYSSVSPFTAQSVTCVGYTAADMVMPGVPSLGHAAGAFGQGSDTSEQHHFKQSRQAGRWCQHISADLCACSSSALSCCHGAVVTALADVIAFLVLGSTAWNNHASSFSCCRWGGLVWTAAEAGGQPNSGPADPWTLPDPFSAVHWKERKADQHL